jgi:hypothetical protein
MTCFKIAAEERRADPGAGSPSWSRIIIYDPKLGPPTPAWPIDASWHSQVRPLAMPDHQVSGTGHLPPSSVATGAALCP